MDPVSALGVAAAAVQFLDAFTKAYRTFQEIKDSSSSSTERNRQLEDNVRSTQILRDGLKCTSTPPDADADPVYAVVKRCTSKAEELLALLLHVRGSGNKIISFFRTIRARSKIEPLYNSIKEDQNTLTQILSQKHLPDIERIKSQQTHEFAKLTEMGEMLLTGQHDQDTARERNLLHDMRNQLCDSLWYPEIDQRQCEIKEPASRTLDWLFAPPLPDYFSGIIKWVTLVNGYARIPPRTGYLERQEQASQH
ncbi:hypothetical protein F5Y17DRAFT_255657 [Xylariaceae sp. FL0594]|nr:hypothetical protein F5Y17DRAFT_255657 [Xylariaceae sp. FL0594]